MSSEIADLLLPWYRSNKRRLSFRDTGDPYRVFVSEIMLQQTRAETVESYFDRFVRRFPDIPSLANAPLEEVLKAWEGLGYYSRARNLQRAAVIMRDRFRGLVPDSIEDLLSLPGVGPYSAAAVASIAYDRRVPAMDGNLYRVFARLYDDHGCVDREKVKQGLYLRALSAMPDTGCGDFNQGMMDLGAGICTPGTPDCARCPLYSVCLSAQRGRPEDLPVKTKKRPPAQKYYAVVLLLHGNRVCLFRRREKMLNSLYVFLLIPLPGEMPETAIAEAVDRYLPARTDAGPSALLGEARHVFTHQVWNMKLLCAECGRELWRGSEACSWADRDTLLSLPMPTAMKAARERALQILSSRKAGDAMNK